MEICATVKAVKYIHKYIYKGCDQTTLRFDKTNEVRQHLNGRYIGPMQAVWELMEYAVHEEYSPVHHLPIHLPGQQPIYFGEDLFVAELQTRMESAQSELMDYFGYKSLHANGRHLLYCD